MAIAKILKSVNPELNNGGAMVEMSGWVKQRSRYPKINMLSTVFGKWKSFDLMVCHHVSSNILTE